MHFLIRKKPVEQIIGVHRGDLGATQPGLPGQPDHQPFP